MFVDEPFILIQEKLALGVIIHLIFNTYGLPLRKNVKCVMSQLVIKNLFFLVEVIVT